MNEDNFEVLIHVLPGGTMPVLQTAGAVGFDVHARAVVDPFQMDPENPNLRKPWFDFHTMPTDLVHGSHVELLPKHGLNPDGTVIDGVHKMVWRIDPGDQALIGIGIALAMPPELFQWLTPRSGLSSKYRVTLGNAPGTVDSDYRGEAGLIVVNEGSGPIKIAHGDRIAQMLFQRVYMPKLIEVGSLEALGTTDRGAGGFGSTGV